ncbi:MAG TPA: hypothetical protein VNW15_05145 [Rhizomicrobium sp.]|nr:hypothetical protein [Rhizomicrobium sp.]
MFPHFRKTLLVLALAAWAAPAFAADPPFTVSNVHVDATGASTTEAFNTALQDGRPKAWQILYRRLTRQQDWPRQPDLDSAALLRISRGYTPGNERRSTTRYVADVTYTFNPQAVARLLQSAGIAYTQGAARRILVVPMSPGFQMGPWAQALNAPALKNSVVPFTVAEETDGLKDLNFDTASWNDVAAAAKRANAAEAALVQSSYANGKLTVNIRRLGDGETPVKTQVDVPLLQTLSATFPSAAAAAIAEVEDMWKTRAAIDYSKGGKLTANVRMASLQQWGAIQTALGNADNITSVTVNAMDIGYAQISISYTGSAEQLRDVLGDAGLTLAPVRGQTGGQTVWTLAMNGGDPQ